MRVKSLELRVKGLENQEGIVLIVSLLLLLVATIIGVTALQTSTTNVMIAGNQRLRETNFSAADAGVYISIPIIENAASAGSVDSEYRRTVTISDDFVDEILGVKRLDPDKASLEPDLKFNIGDSTVSIDVDYLYAGFLQGAAMEFASSYEGLGEGGSAGGIEVYYSITSLSAGAAGSEAEVSAVYKAVYKYVTR